MGMHPALYGTVRMSRNSNGGDEGAGGMDGTFVASHPMMSWPWGGMVPPGAMARRCVDRPCAPRVPPPRPAPR